MAIGLARRLGEEKEGTTLSSASGARGRKRDRRQMQSSPPPPPPVEETIGFLTSSESIDTPLPC